MALELVCELMPRASSPKTSWKEHSANRRLLAVVLYQLSVLILAAGALIVEESLL